MDNNNQDYNGEKDILNQIENETKDIKVPDSLLPEAMEEKLKKHTPKKHKFNFKVMSAVAAGLAVVLIAGIAIRMRTTGELPTSPTNSIAGIDKDVFNSNEIVVAKSYDEIYEYIEANNSVGNLENEVLTDFAVQESADIARSESDTGAATQSLSALEGADYSETNLRQSGVDEGDVVKTDGSYLYILRNQRNEVSIVDANNGNMKEVTSITVDGFNNISEIYVQQERLIIVGNTDTMSIWPLARTMDSEDGTSEDSYVDESLTMIVTYDISKIESPKLLGEMSQSGYYQSSRIVNGYIYLFSNYTVYNNIDANNTSTYIPKINNEVLSENDICLPVITNANNYTVITAVAVDSPEKVISSKAIMAQYGEYYVSNDNIYYYENVWEENQTYTNIRKLSYNDGQIEGVAQGKVNGYLNDSFSIDEYEGNLRLVVTLNDDNALYILNEKLDMIGSIEDLAKDESVYSARLMGDTGYFVTFRQIDPLFSVDLSDPTNPKILGELKIPGFSQYLHPYSDTLLLGIGMDADEETGATQGLKLSMFDISDNTDVQESDTYIMDREYYTNLFYNYKGLMIDTQKNLFGFSAEGMDGENYYLFTYDENNGFVELMKQEVNSSGYMETRGIYIDDTLYVINGNIIESYSLSTYEKIESLIL
ncbi:MAG: beta-propeller domain-containing protein [Suipraeoptans sp.]